MNLFTSELDFLKGTSGNIEDKNEFKKEMYTYFRERYLNKRRCDSFYSLYIEIKNKVGDLNFICDGNGLAKDKYSSYLSVLSF